MSRFLGWLAMGLVVVSGIGFAVANAGREVTIDLGLFTLYSVPVTFVAFGGMVAGMAVMLVAGINADLKVRRLLRDRHMEDRQLAGRGDAPPGEQHKGETLLE